MFRQIPKWEEILQEILITNSFRINFYESSYSISWHRRLCHSLVRSELYCAAGIAKFITNSIMSKVSVIFPVYNEQENIEHLVNELNACFKNEDAFSAEIIFVNDGSTDDTLYKLKNAPHQFYAFKIISFSRNFGSHAALRAGILKAKGDYITFIYADLQDPLSLISELYHEIIYKEADICWAFRNSTRVSKSEKLFSHTYASLMRKYAVPNFPKKGFDVVMFSKKVKTCLDHNIENNSSIFIQILNLGFKQSGITYNKRERLAGKSKWTLSKKIKMLFYSFVAFSFA